ncbi:MAG: hypothetical protein NVS9B4_07280 [Candidatus Acidiferrum sp.]
MTDLRIVKRNSTLMAAAVMFCGLILVGCDDRLERFRDPAVPIARGATWAWRPAPARQRPVISRDVIRGESRRVSRDEGGNTGADNEIVRGRIRIAIEKELARKGLRRVDDPQAASFLVDYRAGIQRENLTVQHVYPGGYGGLVCGPFGCWDSWGYGPPQVSYENIRFREGTIVFRFVERGTDQLAYRALGEKRVTRDYFKQEKIDQAVETLLKGLKPGQ